MMPLQIKKIDNAIVKLKITFTGPCMSFTGPLASLYSLTLDERVCSTSVKDPTSIGNLIFLLCNKGSS